jgi:hypothetical protein
MIKFLVSFLKKDVWKSFRYLLLGVFAGLLSLSAFVVFRSGGEVRGAKSCEEFSLSSEDVFTSFSLNRRWFLLGDELSPDGQMLELSLDLKEEGLTLVRSFDDPRITYTIAETEKSGDFYRESVEGVRYQATIGLGDLHPGTYTVQASLDFRCGELVSRKRAFNVSYPLYLSWTLDWEGYDVKDQYLADIAQLAKSHNNLPLTHFYNPYIFVNPAISKGRSEELTGWVKKRRDQYGEAIGLHLHMFPDMVEEAGVTPRKSPGWGSFLSEGYDVPLSAYTYRETLRLLSWSKEVFTKQGLGSPTIFRAGGWFADEETLKALEDSDFLVDSSGRTKVLFGENGLASPWDLKKTTQPYRPNLFNQNSPAEPNSLLWEFPNNGGDSWSFTVQELIERFYANFGKKPLGRRKLVTYLSHPEWFYKDAPKIERLLNETDKYLYARDKGPVIYVDLEDAYKIWTSK